MVETFNITLKKANCLWYQGGTKVTLAFHFCFPRIPLDVIIGSLRGECLFSFPRNNLNWLHFDFNIELLHAQSWSNFWEIFKCTEERVEFTRFRSNGVTKSVKLHSLVEWECSLFHSQRPSPKYTSPRRCVPKLPHMLSNLAWRIPNCREHLQHN